LQSEGYALQQNHRIQSGVAPVDRRISESTEKPHRDGTGWLADDAVHFQPVSASNSLLTGKNTGKFATVARRQVVVSLEYALFTGFSDESHKIQNREFCGREQGKGIRYQGNPPAPFLSSRFTFVSCRLWRMLGGASAFETRSRHRRRTKFTHFLSPLLRCPYGRCVWRQGNPRVT